MHRGSVRFAVGLGWLIVVCCLLPGGQSQETPAGGPDIAPPAGDPAPMPKGVEVLARGPVHEAFASLTGEPAPTKPVGKRPPKPLEEMPPDQKPEGDMQWVSGYWQWDDDRNDYLWVSGIWRAPPPNKQWIAGYWRENGDQWQWVPGFWSQAEPATATTPATVKQDVTYLPAPPAPPQTASPGEPPAADSFYVPGVWVWSGNGYAWRAGYWARVQPGYVWVSGHYRWTPSGYIYIPGYWDYAIARRGVLYAPVVVDMEVVGPGYVYTPAYVVRDTIVVDALFVRPSYCHYYFGDYYGVTYRDRGFETCVVYSHRCYEPIFVYERYEHRHEPRWEGVYLEVSIARHEGRAPLPPRTLVQQRNVVNNVTVINNNTTVNNTTINKTVNNNQVLMPASQLSAATGKKTVPVDPATRRQVQQQAQSVQQVAAQRQRTEVASPGIPSQPRTAALNVPRQPIAPMSATSSAVRPTTSGNATTTSGVKPYTPPGSSTGGNATNSAASATHNSTGSPTSSGATTGGTATGSTTGTRPPTTSGSTTPPKTQPKPPTKTPPRPAPKREPDKKG